MEFTKWLFVEARWSGKNQDENANVEVMQCSLFTWLLHPPPHWNSTNKETYQTLKYTLHCHSVKYPLPRQGIRDSDFKH